MSKTIQMKTTVINDGVKTQENGYPITTPDRVVDSNGVSVDTKLAGKINEPNNEGTSGQVLTTNGAGGRTWTTISSSGEPDAYLKSASISGNTLTITKKDNSTVIYKPAVSYATSTISASSGWSSNTYTALNSTYPFASYDVEVSISPSATTTQRDAYASAMFTGATDSNNITALGDKPTINIPIILKLWGK